ncbi:hypothetical protein [Hymenobacter sp. AT01-02]|uniref:hypothetical protein n=1 Tax=Hymenobacter sp. AT01-02 TaxID=1571877 RepID=UPI00128F9087|nr:hypothetical protein [Hymenobacter sp. AT01-02]
MKSLFLPNGRVPRTTFALMAAAQGAVLLLLWLFYPLRLFPSLSDVLRALADLVSTQGLVQELWASMTTALQALGAATVLALLISYLTALPSSAPWLMRPPRCATSPSRA